MDLTGNNPNKKNVSPKKVLSCVPIASITGVVVHGKGRGKTVGMPTANICFAETADCFGAIPNGVYASVVRIDFGNGNENFIGVTNVGNRPTVDEEKTIETHILDFDRDIYEKTIEVDLILFLRGIEKFGSLEEVKKQVELDIARTREIFGNSRGGLEADK